MAATSDNLISGDSDSAGYDPTFVPDYVRSFVVHMYRHIREKNVYEIHQMYETSFQSISDRFFKDTAWPIADAVAPYVDHDHVFCLLYSEMWFRHVYARLSPTLEQRIESWENYCELFRVRINLRNYVFCMQLWLSDVFIDIEEIIVDAVILQTFRDTFPFHNIRNSVDCICYASEDASLPCLL